MELEEFLILVLHGFQWKEVLDYPFSQREGRKVADGPIPNPAAFISGIPPFLIPNYIPICPISGGPSGTTGPVR